MNNPNAPITSPLTNNNGTFLIPASSPQLDNISRIDIQKVNEISQRFYRVKTIFEAITTANFDRSFVEIRKHMDVVGNELISWLNLQNNHLDYNQYAIFSKYTEFQATIAGLHRINKNDRIAIQALIELVSKNIELQRSRNVAPFLKFAMGADASTGDVISLYAVETDTTFENIIGMDEIKYQIQSSIDPLAKKLIGESYRRLLMFGPPGTGKTEFAKAIAGELKATLIILTPSVLLDPILGVSEKRLESIINGSQETDNDVVVFFDEMENLFNREDNTEVNKSLTVQFLNLVNERLKSNLFIIGATNFIKQVDDAVRSRLNNIIYVGLPNADTRVAIFNSKFPNNPLLQTNLINTFITLTENYSNRDIITFCQNIKKYQVDAVVTSQYFIVMDGVNFNNVIGIGLSPLESPNGNQILSFNADVLLNIGNFSGQIFVISRDQRNTIPSDFFIPPPYEDFFEKARLNIFPITDLAKFDM